MNHSPSVSTLKKEMTTKLLSVPRVHLRLEPFFFFFFFLGEISAISGHVPKRGCARGGLQMHHGSFYQVRVTRSHQMLRFPAALVKSVDKKSIDAL